MVDLFSRISQFVQNLAAGPVPLPSAVIIPPALCLPPSSSGEYLLKDQCYITLTVNELFLANARQAWANYQPMAVVATSFVQGKATVTLPAVVGPSLLAQPGQALPQGLLLNDIEVAGPIPYRGGNITISIVLYRVKHTDYAQKLLKLVEGVSRAVGPTANLDMLSKVGGPLLDGLEGLLGLGETEALMGQRFTLSPIAPGGVRTFYAALIGSGTFVSPQSLSVDLGRLRSGAGPDAAPFRAADYVLYNLSAPARRTDESTLPFYPLFERAKQDAYRGGDDNWKAAKATFSELWQQMMISPDVTVEQAKELFARWKEELLYEKKHGEDDRLLSVDSASNVTPDARTHTAAEVLDL